MATSSTQRASEPILGARPILIGQDRLGSYGAQPSLWLILLFVP